MNHFVWVDLSTFDAGKAQRFYQRVLGWSYHTDAAGYTTAYANGRETAGLYPMPDFFRKINMPSFWMSYIQVEDVDATVQQAESLGGKIELQEDNAFGRVALIRDPLGAGFTCIQNHQMQSARGEHPGQCCGSELVISDPDQAAAFYAPLFGWSFKPAGNDQHMIHHASGDAIASVQVASNDIKGDKEYWAVYFAVQDLARAQQAIEQAGGSVVYTYDTPAGQVLVAHDDQGAAFQLTAG